MSGVGPVTGGLPGLGSRRERVLTVARLGGLGAVVWGAVHQQARSLAGEHAALPVLLVVAGAGWLGWMASRRFSTDTRVTLWSLVLLAIAGAVAAAYAPVSLAFLAVAGLGAGVALEPPTSVLVALAGFLALCIAVGVLGSPDGASVVAEGALSAAAGTMAGTSRRQYLARASQAEELLAERVRADAERDRATALAERNRLGREIHDVLAHSLGALSVQLDAADALLEQKADPERARALVQQARRLAVTGLEETRQAVHALRDEPVALAEQLASLAAREGAALEVTGTPRVLGAEAGLALYRAAQEALTNARKHAPGAQVSIRLRFEVAATALSVVNGAVPGGPPSPAPGAELGATGGGFGLRGMRERIELLGGGMTAEHVARGFAVEVMVPA